MNGDSGKYLVGNNYNGIQAAGNAKSIGYSGYYTTSGKGYYNEPGTAAYIMILRGNTNLPLDQLNAQEITTLSLAMTKFVQEQTGMLLQS